MEASNSFLSKAIEGSRTLSRAATPSPAKFPNLNLDPSWALTPLRTPPLKKHAPWNHTSLPSMMSASSSSPHRSSNLSSSVLLSSTPPPRSPMSLSRIVARSAMLSLPLHDQYSPFEQDFAARLNKVRSDPQRVIGLREYHTVTYENEAGKVVNVNTGKAHIEMAFHEKALEEAQAKLSALPRLMHLEITKYVQNPPAGARPPTQESSMRPGGKEPKATVVSNTGPQNGTSGQTTNTTSNTLNPGKAAAAGKRRSMAHNEPPHIPEWALHYELQLKEKYKALQHKVEKDIATLERILRDINHGVQAVHITEDEVMKKQPCNTFVHSRGLSLYAREMCHSPHLPGFTSSGGPIIVVEDAFVQCDYGATLGDTTLIVLHGTLSEAEAVAALCTHPKARDIIFHDAYKTIGVGWQPTKYNGASLVLYFTKVFQESCGVVRRDHMSLYFTKRDMSLNHHKDDNNLLITLLNPHVRMVSPQYQPLECDGIAELILESPEDVCLHAVLLKNVSPSASIVASESSLCHNVADVYWHRAEGYRTHFFVRCPTTGNHRLEIFCKNAFDDVSGGGGSTGGSLRSIGFISLRCTKPLQEGFLAYSFPSVTVGFHDRRCRIECPLESPLPRSNVTEQTFRVVIPVFNYLEPSRRTAEAELSTIHKKSENIESQLLALRAEHQQLAITHEQEIESRVQYIKSLSEQLPAQSGRSMRKLAHKEQERQNEILAQIAEKQSELEQVKEELTKKENQMEGLEKELKTLRARQVLLENDMIHYTSLDTRTAPLNVRLVVVGHRREIPMKSCDDQFTVYECKYKVHRIGTLSCYVDGVCIISWNVV